MNEADAIDLARQALWTVLVAAGPAVIAGMVIGILVAFVQALTQLQEATLTFVPKMLVIIMVMALAGSFIGSEIGAFTQSVYRHIETGF